jgi:type II secretory pathway pseudopilin PulG
MSRPGASLLEVAAVLGIAALLAGTMAAAGLKRIEEGRLERTLTELEAFRTALRAAREADGAWPTSLGGLRGRYLPAAAPLANPWGAPYTLAVHGPVATVATDVPVRLGERPGWASWVAVSPLPGGSRLEASTAAPAATAALELERRRLEGTP